MLLAQDRAPCGPVAAQVRPIAACDVERVAEFLHTHLNRRVSKDAWARAMDAPWSIEKPNSGFMLLDNETVVGAYLAFYSERDLDGRPERVCNLGAWCVLPEHRFYSLLLLKALLAQEGYSFTDLSPSDNVIPLNTRLGFGFLDTATSVVPNLPWPGSPRRHVVSADPELITRTLTGRNLEIYRDHVGADAARHLVLIRDGEWCYVMFRKDRRKGMPLLASILYVSDAGLFGRMARPLARHLLIRHGVLVTLAEERIVGQRPRPSFQLRSPRRKMFRSAHLDASQVDYLYSELVCVSW